MTTALTQQLKHGAEQALESLAEGWRELRARAGGALTRFRPARDAATADDEQLPSMGRWAFIAADVFDDDRALIVRLEVPGMRREDFRIELTGDTLSVQGEKRFDRESKRGGYHVVQCAYGSFRRDIRLPVAVRPDRAEARYRDGVLRIALPKAEGAAMRRLSISVH